MAAFHPEQFYAAFNIGNLQNVPLSQIASRYGPGFADYVQGYYTEHPTARFQAITGAYEASRNRITTSGGSYAATGELALTPVTGPETFTGRSAEYAKSWAREVYGVGAPDAIQEYYNRQAGIQAVERPGYTVPKDIGDITTQRAISGYTAFSQAMALTGVELASPMTMMGQVLEIQRQAAYATPQRRDETFYMGELQKWAQNYVETSSAYHHIGMRGGVPIPANPYEYQGDLAVEFLKGAPQKASEYFSPVSGEMSKYLPGGEGIQQYAWREAVAVDRRMQGKASEMPEQVSFMAGVQYLGAAEGLYGPYGNLAGGIKTGGVPAGRVTIQPFTPITAASAPESVQGATGLPKPFISTSSAAEVPTTAPQIGSIPEKVFGMLTRIPSVVFGEKREVYMPLTIGMVAGGPAKIEGVGFTAAAPVIERIPLTTGAPVAFREILPYGQEVPGAAGPAAAKSLGAFWQEGAQIVKGAPKTLESAVYGGGVPGAVSEATAKQLGAFVPEKLYEMGAPLALVITGAQAATVKAPDILHTDIFTGKVLTPEQEQQTIISSTKNYGLSGGLIGQTVFGEKSPEVIKGALGSVSDYITGMVGWTPFKERMQVTENTTGTTPELYAAKTELFERQRADYESNLSKYQEGLAQYEQAKGTSKSPEWYNQLNIEKQSLDKQFTTLAATKASLDVERQSLKDIKIYEYGEFSKWGEGAGNVVRNTLGFNKEQLETYGLQLEQKKGIEYIPEKIVYGTGYTLSTRPEKIISAYGAGAALVFGGEIIGGLAEGSGLAARGAAIAAQHPVAASITTGAIRYGIPAALAGATYYQASEGLTASPERTTINIGKITPELGGMLYGAGSAYGVLGAARAGYLGYVTKETKYVKGFDPLEIDLTGKYPKANVGGHMGTVEYPTPSPENLIIGPGQEPFVISGKTRAPISDLPITETILQQEPGTLAFDPWLRARATGQAGPTFAERVTTSEFARQQGSLGVQPPSARTTLLREQQAAAWEQVIKTGGAPLPMDFLPGVGRIEGLRTPAMSGLPEFTITPEMARSVGISIQPAGIGKATGKGLQFTGAPMSQQMLESVVTQGPIRSGTYADVDAMIKQMDVYARVKPAVEMAKSQEILPSATTQTFTKPVEFKDFENILTGILESEKPVAGPTAKRAAGPKAFEGKVELGPTRDTLNIQRMKENAKVYDDFFANQWNAPKQPAATAWKRWTPPAVISPTISIPRTKTTSSSGTARPAAVTNLPVQKPVTGPAVQNLPASQNMPGIQNLPDVASFSGQTPSTRQIQSSDQAYRTFAPFAAAAAAAVPFISPAISTTIPPSGPVLPELPTKPVPGPTLPTTPTPPPITPTPTVPKPPVTPPVLPPLTGGLLGGGGGGLGGGRKRTRHFMEILPLGLDIGGWGRAIRGRRPGKTVKRKAAAPAKGKSGRKKKR